MSAPPTFLVTAKAVGIKQIVLVGSKGGTNLNHPLNSIGLMACMTEMEVSASFLSARMTSCLRQIRGPYIARPDVAKICLQALHYEEAKFKAFDLASKPEGAGTPTKDFKELFS